MSSQSHPVPRVVLAMAFAWSLVVCGGVVWVWAYKSTPGIESGPPHSWPDGAGLRRSGTTLVVTFHPLCTCSDATAAELARLLASLEDRPTVYALFVDFNPRGDRGTALARAQDTPLWKRVSAIPGVITVSDPHGATATLFGAETSGDVIAYSASGRLLFHGGLTPARGHEGDSFGRQRLLAVLRGERTDATISPVFGCPLHDRTSSSPPPSHRSEGE